MTERHDHETPSPHDAEISRLLGRVTVPDHRDGFWDDLARQMTQADPSGPVRHVRGHRPPVLGATPTPESAPSGVRSIAPLAWRLLVAAAVLALLGGVALLRVGSDDGSQRVDSGLAATSGTDGADPSPATDPASTSTVRGQSTWLYADSIEWNGDEFVTSAVDGAHETSPDGIDWQRHDGPGPLPAAFSDCLPELTCDAAPDAPAIPFHFAETGTRVLARAGDVVLLQSSVTYSPLEVVAADDGPMPRRVHPDLLAAAAPSDPCFAELAQQDPATVATAGSEQARLRAVDRYGVEDRIVSVTCVKGSQTAVFELHLSDHLDDMQIEALSSGRTEMWVESPGSPPERVDDFPTDSSWNDSVVGGDLITSASRVVSSGDRFWAVDEGTLVSSADGSAWIAHEVPTAGAEIDRVAAGPGGHLALWLVEDRLVAGESGQVIVSHDGGSTWSEPVDLTVGWLSDLSVGPAGAAVSSTFDDPDFTTNVAIVDGLGPVVTLPGFADNVGYGLVAVGVDRVLVRSFTRMDVFGLDGTLLHRTTWVDGGDQGRARWLYVLLSGAAAVPITVLVRRHRRRSPDGTARTR